MPPDGAYGYNEVSTSSTELDLELGFVNPVSGDSNSKSKDDRVNTLGDKITKDGDATLVTKGDGDATHVTKCGGKRVTQTKVS